MLRKIIFITILMMLVPALMGCPGNSRKDIEIREATWAWCEQSDIDGWQIIGWGGDPPTGIIVEHKLRPARIDIAIDPSRIHPQAQRNLLETIARHWLNEYAVNTRPRFELHVYFYDTKISHESELGFTSIDKDMNVDTHHVATQDIV